MPLINREELLVVVIDIQERLLPAICNGDAVVKKTIQLLQGASKLEAPIILSEQYPKGLGNTQQEILDAINKEEESGAKILRIEKTTFSCTKCKDFAENLKSLKRKQIVLCGIESHICVTQTALGLIEQGFSCFIAADAIASRDSNHTAIAIERMRDAGATILPVESILYEGLIDSKHSAFKDICKIIK